MEQRRHEGGRPPPPSAQPELPPDGPSRQSVRGLDGLNFFLANIQTGFGPFIAVYLTAEKWTQADIGLVLTVGSIAALVGQVPSGILVDAAPSKRLIAALAAVAIAASALMLAAWPLFLSVVLAEVLHGVASCLMGPAIAAISLGLVSRSGIGERLGRNARYASLGNGVAAALMGACGRLLSTRAVFIITAILAIPALLSLRAIRPAEIDPVRARGGPVRLGPRNWRARLHGIVDNKPLLIFGGGLLMFHLANAAMLPLVGGMLTMEMSAWATILIALCIVVPQIVVAALSPWVGREAESRGRRPLLLLGFAALAVRGMLLAVAASPHLVVAIQLLDGVSAAVLGVMLPLIVADTTRGSGHFNAALGVVGTAAAIGASLSTTLAGYIADSLGNNVAFACLAVIAALGWVLLWAAMPETRRLSD